MTASFAPSVTPKDAESTRHRPSMPELRIVISDQVPRTVVLDSEDSSLISPQPEDVQEQQPFPPRSATSLSARSVSTSPNVSIFSNPIPFGAQPNSRATSNTSEPEPKASLSRKNVKKLSLTSLDKRPSVSPTPSMLSFRSIAPNNVPVSLPPSPHFPHRKMSLNPAPATVNNRFVPPTKAGIPVRRRSSIVSLPPTTSSKYSNKRMIEDDSNGDPYQDGPVEILPGVWLGAEENAQDWSNLVQNSIGAILNVAKEVELPFDNDVSFEVEPLAEESGPRAKRFGPDSAIGRPALSYLHLNWSHGQSDLVKQGFVHGMAFIDQSLRAGTGVLIHCQCGISRSATLAIAYVMRAAHAEDAPPPLASLKKQGMQGAYTFVKNKSQWVGPNMSLIYQLLEYERFLSPDSRAPSDASANSDEEEWTRQRKALDEEEVTSPVENSTIQTAIETAEARELDQRMIDRRDQLNRQASRTSVASTTVSDNGAGWKSRFGPTVGRARGMSVGSDRTSRSSLISADSLVEVDEEGEDYDPEEDNYSSGSRKSSLDVDTDEGGTYVQLPSVHQVAQTVILPPIDPSRRKGSLTIPPSAPASRLSFPSTRPRFDQLSVSSTSSSRRVSEASLLSSKPDQTSFNIPPPSASATQTTFGLSAKVPFPLRRSHSPSLGPPPTRTTLRSQGSMQRVLDTVPPSPSSVETDNAIPSPERKKSRPLSLSLPRIEPVPNISLEQDEDRMPHPVEKKLRPSPLLASVLPRRPNITAVQSDCSDDSFAPGSVSSSESISRRSSNSSRSSWLRRQTPLYAPISTATNLIGSATPHQTLFIFPASPPRSHILTSPTGDTTTLPVPPTPSTMLLTTTMNPIPPLEPTTIPSGRLSSSSSVSSESSVRTRSSASRKRVSALPSGMTPTLAAFRSSIHNSGIRRVDWGGVSTPTTATAHVEARGWVVGSGRSENVPLSPLSARGVTFRF